MSVAAAVAAMILAGGTVIATAPQAMTGHTVGDITFSDSCQSMIKMCHMVYSRHYTKNVLAPAASGAGTSFTAAATAGCMAVGGPAVAWVCTGVAGSWSGAAVGAINQAAAQNQCADYVSDSSNTVGWFKTNNGPDCKD